MVCVCLCCLCVLCLRVLRDVWRDGVWFVFCCCCCLCVLLLNLLVRCVYDVQCAVVWFVACAVLHIVRVGCNVFECVFMRALLHDVVWFVFRCVFVFVCVVVCV